jgi:hypothetical protein
VTKQAAHAPSKPSLDDNKQPTNPELWRQVLDVASGERKVLTGIGGRTIHAPNHGRGFRNMPANPHGIGWAIKQYNAYGGGWKPQKEIQAHLLDTLTLWLTSPTSYHAFRVAGHAPWSRVVASEPQLVLGGAVVDLEVHSFDGKGLQASLDTLDLQIEVQEKSCRIAGMVASQGGLAQQVKLLGFPVLLDCIFRATGDRVANLALGAFRPIGGGHEVKYSTNQGSGTLRVVLQSCYREGQTGLVPSVTCTPDASQIPLLTASRVAERFVKGA